MSRLPPEIEQIINGKKVDWYSILPIIDDEWVRYELSMNHVYDTNGSPIWMNYFVSAFSIENALRWKTLYSSIDFDLLCETDVQEVYPVDFFLDQNQLITKHEFYSENDRIYRVMRNDGDIKLKSHS